MGGQFWEGLSPATRRDSAIRRAKRRVRYVYVRRVISGAALDALAATLDDDRPA